MQKKHESEDMMGLKRAACFLLSVVLLILLIPAGAVTASAESAFVTSSECIAMLKEFEGFSKYPYWDYSQYTVGYGTRCPDEDLSRYMSEGITEEEAETLLRVYLSGDGTSQNPGIESVINRFFDRNGLTMTQSQFDALILFTYNCGTSWMNDTEGEFRSAVVNGATGNAFLYPITLWCSADGTILDGLIRRRLIEANMYLNGVYSSSVPENYCYVRYDVNGGDFVKRIQAYDSVLTASIIPTPTREGCLFDGWYTARDGGTKVTVLDASVRNKTLIARWVDSSGNVVSGTVTTPIDPVTVTVNTDGVNLREGPGTEYAKVGTANYGDTFTITAVCTGGSYTWGQYDGGWLVLSFTNYGSVSGGTETDPSEPGDTTPDEPTPDEPETDTPPEDTTPSEPAVKTLNGTVNTDELNIRQKPTIYGEWLGYYYAGDRVEIIEQAEADGLSWGKTEKGWICMKYVDLDTDTPDENPDEEPPEETEPETESLTGTVNTDELNIREKPTIYGEWLGYYYAGDRVEITEQAEGDGLSWGRTDKGWICMDYVDLDSDKAQTENPFEDLEESKYYYEPVLWAYSKGITTGTDDTHFSPNKDCNRQQMVMFLWRYAGEPVVEDVENPFTDVSESSRFYDAIMWAVSEGITTGKTETTFAPTDNCTRQQMVMFLYRMAGEPDVIDVDNPFEDVSDGDRFCSAILWAYSTGVTTGKTATTFEGTNTCTRGQFVTFLYRMAAE